MGSADSESALRACGLDTPYEVLLTSISTGLLQDQRLPAGAVVDAGAHLGNQACVYARYAPARRVHAIEPLAANALHIESKYAARIPNLRVTNGGLGASPGWVALNRGTKVLKAGGMLSIESMQVSTTETGTSKHGFRVYTLDELFLANETLALVHLDVEGMELAVLRGGNRTIARDRPITSTECHVLSDVNFTASLLDFFSARTYVSFLVDEVCGVRTDCRNLLHVPREHVSLFADSPLLNLAIASRALVRLPHRGGGARAVAHVKESATATPTRTRQLHRCGRRCGYGEMLERWHV